MRKYDDDQERTIRLGRLVEDWTRSGLLDATQRERLAPELRVDLRRTNRFLRLTLFGFGLLIIAAAVGLVFLIFDVDDEMPAGTVCLLAGGLCLLLTETLVERFRLYRFGIEEAAAVATVVLMGLAAMLLAGSLSPGPTDVDAFLGLLAGAAAAFLMYLRFGFVYAAVASMALASLAPLQLNRPEFVQRLLGIAVLGGFFAGARLKRREQGDEFPGDDYGLLQAAAWLGIYALTNLHLPFGLATPAIGTWFYSITYALIWILPPVGLWIAIRDRDRPLLDVNLAMALATLMTNKPYLFLERRTWDPVLFGVLLIGVALMLRRWLAAGPGGSRRGFTALRLLLSDKEKLAVVATASAAVHTAPVTHPEPASDEPFKGGGGRSGGAGASGGF